MSAFKIRNNLNVKGSGVKKKNERRNWKRKSGKESESKKKKNERS